MPGRALLGPQESATWSLCYCGSKHQAKLAKSLRTLYDLWKEYEFDFDSCKAMKNFTQVERGKERYTYYRRNVFWQAVCSIIRMGFTQHHRAINKIYNVYGAS